MKRKGIVDGEKQPNVVTLPLPELLRMLAEAREEGRRSVATTNPFISPWTPAPAPWQAPTVTITDRPESSSRTWIRVGDGTEPGPQISWCTQ